MTTLALLLSSFMAVQVGGQFTPTELESRWRSEYPAAVAELSRIAENFQAKGTVIFHFISGEIMTTNALTVAAVDGKKVVVKDKRVSEPPKKPKKPYPSDVSCKTKGYSFVLNKADPSLPYLIAYYGEAPEPHFDEDFSIYANASMTFRQQPFLDRVNHPSFAVKSIESLQRLGAEVVRIEYSWSKGDFSETGFVVLDPAKHWAILNAEGIVKWKESGSIEYTSKVKYRDMGKNVFFPDHVEYFGKTEIPDHFEHRILALDEIRLDNISPEIFRLTGYGLPDIPLKPLKSASFFSYKNPVLWISLVLAAVSFGLLYITRNRKTIAST